jgi:amidohydrolase
MAANVTATKSAVAALINSTHRDSLIALSHLVHANPEPSWEEHKSVQMVAEPLAKHKGFTMIEKPAGLDTAFMARAGSGPLHIGICAEYDALPGIGHACGHNIIASAAVGAGLALADVADELGIIVTVFGTPAEEGGGGKITMLNAGLFDNVHVGMMVHPAPAESDRMHCLAVSHFDVHYHGRTAHASAFPDRGINAADAITVAQTSIGLLRQHIKPTDRLHGIVIKGGDAPNIVPDNTTFRMYVRSRTVAELKELRPRIDRIFEAGALATGCTHEIDEASEWYSEFLDDEETLALYRANAESIGRKFPAAQKPRAAMTPHNGEDAISASTDMANVSLKIPSIHPMLGIEAKGASNHQPEFTAACATESADKAVLDGALAMALTCIDLATQDAHRNRLLNEAWPK